VSYQHIENLYRPEAQRILEFRWVYAMEKIHGTSANLLWNADGLHLHPGGEGMERFSALFGSLLPPVGDITQKLQELFSLGPVSIYGEAYGGKCQGMRKTYGDQLRFIAFEVQVAGCWLAVPQAENVCQKLGIPFVWYDKVATDVPTLDGVRDRPSEQAKRNGITEERHMEGIVLRPPFEVTLNNGSRLLAKHKRAEFSERETIPDVDPTTRQMLENAEAIADEFVTEMRLTHVLDKLQAPMDFKSIPLVIAAMKEDVCREASGEIVESKDVLRAIGGKTVKLYKARIVAMPNT